MDARVDFLAIPSIAGNIKQLSSAGHLPDSVFPTATAELCRLRASQINGCGFCTDMHVKDALAAGEDPQRLHLVAALARGHGLHRGRACRPGGHRAGHPYR